MALAHNPYRNLFYAYKDCRLDILHHRIDTSYSRYLCSDNRNCYRWVACFASCVLVKPLGYTDVRNLGFIKIHSFQRMADSKGLLNGSNKNYCDAPK